MTAAFESEGSGNDDFLSDEIAPFHDDTEREEVTTLELPFTVFEAFREELLEAAVALGEDVGPEKYREFNMRHRLVLDGFSECVKTILADTSDQQVQIDTVVQLMLEQEARHQEVFRWLTGLADYEQLQYNRDGLVAEIKSSLESAGSNTNEARILITRVFMFGLKKDVDQFLQKLPQLAQADAGEPIELDQQVYPEPEMESRASYIAHVLGEHALDVAKIAGGTMIALYLSGRMNRKK